MSEIIVETENKNGQNLPNDVMVKIASKITGSIFLIEQKVVKVECLKTPMSIRSYRELPIKKTEVHIGTGNKRGLLVNGDTFFNGGNTKLVTGEEVSLDKKNGEENREMFFVALDEKTAKKQSVNYNVLKRQELLGMAQTIQNTIVLYNDVIDADSK
jgi:hypothetical protein